MTRPATIALATYDRLPELADDDRLLAAELARLGARARPAVWNDPRVDWASFDAVVVRSCWDYHLAPRPFLDWADGLASSGVPVWNPPAVVRWNADKHYLGDLAAKGARIPETVFLGRRAAASAVGILEALGPGEVVVKPAVSATAYRTARIGAEEPARLGDLLAEILPDAGALVQRYLPDVAERGEWSLMFFGGAYSHAVLKRPRAGDFRVQSDFGGSADPADPPEALVREAARVLESTGFDLLYARVDCVDLPEGPCLMELELIEPSLFLSASHDAARRLAREILVRL
jgi:glutathione synthase/RimK-type ligase-like ATP-grasp enzyme